MTAQLAPRPERGAPRPSTGSPRPQLRPVPPARRRMATVPFVGVVALVLALGMVGLLVLTTALQDQAFTVEARQSRAEQLADQLAELEAQAAQARSVQSLAVAAQELGMKPNPYGAQLVVPDGSVIGTARSVTGGEIPSVRYLTPEQAQAQREALAKAEAERQAKLKAQAQERKKKAEEAAKKKAAEERKKAAEKKAAEKKAEDAAKKGKQP